MRMELTPLIQPRESSFCSSLIWDVLLDDSLRERDHLVGKVSYGASKCALNMMIRAMSHEVKQRSTSPLKYCDVVPYLALPQVTDVALVLVHTGWVATDMGTAGGRSPPITVPDSATKMIKYLTRCTIEDHGKFYDITSDNEIPW